MIVTLREEKMQIGDIVVRKSYDKDITFKIIDIKEIDGRPIYILKGISIRIIADSSADDLEEVDSKVDLLPMSNYKKLCIKQALRAKDKKTIANLKEAVRYLVVTQNIGKEVAYNENVAEWNAKLVKQLNFDFGDLAQEYILVTLQCVLREENLDGEYFKKWYSLVRGAKNNE